MKQAISIIVPTYKGMSLLSTNLPSILKTLEVEKISYKLILVDDGGGKEEKDNLKICWPKAVVIALRKRKGYGCAINWGISLCSTDWALILNNDITIEPGSSIIPMIEATTERDVFSITPCVKNIMRGYRDEGYSLKILKDGLIKNYLPGIIDNSALSSRLTEHTFMHGGCSLVNVKQFRNLGGYDPIFLPGYWEDADISMRAQKAGLKVLYQPHTTFIHQHSQTMGKLYRPWRKEYLNKKNWFLFNFKHLHNGQLIKGVLKNIYIVFRQRDFIKALSLLAAITKYLK